MEGSAGEGRTLVLVRHAKSSWDTDEEDHERPLSGRGRRDAAALGVWLREHDLRPDLVLCSTATRAQETWERAAGTLGRPGPREVRDERSIYHAWVPELVGLVRQAPARRRLVLLVGHAPGVPDLVDHLCRRTGTADWDRLEAKFPTCGVAVVDVPGPWAEVRKGCAELQTFAVPRG